MKMYSCIYEDYIFINLVITILSSITHSYHIAMMSSYSYSTNAKISYFINIFVINYTDVVIILNFDLIYKYQ